VRHSSCLLDMGSLKLIYEKIGLLKVLVSSCATDRRKCSIV
jgi:hypothetical protein